MKRNLVIVLLLVVFTTMEMRAQEWTTTGTTVHPTTLTNNVGIGTSNAKGMLHFANGYGNRRIVLFVNQDNDNEFYGFGMSPSTLRFQIPTASNYFRFYAGNGANASNEIAVLTGGGALGLGITQPAARIHVNSSVPRILMSDQDEPVSSSNPAWAVRAENTSGNFIIQNTTQADYAVFTDNLRITPAGTVGIGTNSPGSSYKLDVNGPVRTRNIVAQEHITVNKAGTSGPYRLALNGQAHGYIVGRNDQEQAKFTISADGTSYFNGGNVGIGTNAPDQALTVKGKIHTQEVIVDLLGAVAPDYVFEESYDLLSLEETEAYIEENKHLPEIPSAKEMEENGVQLKEMNLLLLKKIEELTLHLINQNKLIEEQQKSLAEQKSLLEKQNARITSLEQKEKHEN